MARPSLHACLSQNHMNTTFEFRVSVSPGERSLAECVLEEGHSLVTQLEDELTEFKACSPVAQLNESAVGEPVEFTPAGWELWTRAMALKKRTGGTFDPLFRGGGNGVEWDRDEGKIWRTSPTAHVGFGAIGKGFALDRVRTHLESHGLQNYILSAGGSSQILSGFAQDEEPWVWGWSWKRDGESQWGVRFFHGSGRPLALGISGFHEKGRHIEGDTSNLSALVGFASATEADALSTALLIGGMDRSDWAEEGMALATIDEKEVPRWNGVFQDLWGPVLSFLVWAQTAVGEEVDLSELGMDDFRPYLVERDPLWILLPLLSLFLVGLHLMKPGPRPLNKETWEKPK